MIYPYVRIRKLFQSCFLWPLNTQGRAQGECSSECVHLGGVSSLFCAKCDDVLAVLPPTKLLPSCSSDYLAAHLTKLQWCNEAVGKVCGKNTDLLIWESMHILAKKKEHVYCIARVSSLPENNS